MSHIAEVVFHNRCEGSFEPVVQSFPRSEEDGFCESFCIDLRGVEMKFSQLIYNLLYISLAVCCFAKFASAGELNIRSPRPNFREAETSTRAVRNAALNLGSGKIGSNPFEARKVAFFERVAKYQQRRAKWEVKVAKLQTKQRKKQAKVRAKKERALAKKRDKMLERRLKAERKARKRAEAKLKRAKKQNPEVLPPQQEQGAKEVAVENEQPKKKKVIRRLRRRRSVAQEPQAAPVVERRQPRVVQEEVIEEPGKPSFLDRLRTALLGS